MAQNQTPTSTRAALVAFAGLLLALAAGLALGIDRAEGVKSTLIGATAKVPEPSCPLSKKLQKKAERDPTFSIPSYKQCNAFGHVTGFQIRTKDRKGIYKAKSDGKIVAWSVKLSKPRSDPSDKDLADERAFFEKKLSDKTFDRYGGDPVANISVLKKVGRGRFKLGKQSPIVELDSLLGEKPIITLEKPIKVQKGRIVALTTPTWVTNFALANSSGKGSLSNKHLWRASREPDRCEVEVDSDGNVDDRNLTTRSKPQVKQGSTKKFGCIYSGAQILYWAYFVPSKKKDDGGKKKRVVRLGP